MRFSRESHAVGWKTTVLESFKNMPPILPINCFGINCIITRGGHDVPLLKIEQTKCKMIWIPINYIFGRTFLVRHLSRSKLHDMVLVMLFSIRPFSTFPSIREYLPNVEKENEVRIVRAEIING